MKESNSIEIPATKCRSLHSYGEFINHFVILYFISLEKKRHPPTLFVDGFHDDNSNFHQLQGFQFGVSPCVLA